jgi:hypothetical protein
MQAFFILLKNNIKTILGALLTIVVLFVVYKLFRSISKKTGTVADTLVDKAQTEAITKATGIESKRINLCKKIAYDISMELETNINITWFQRSTNVAEFSTIKGITDQLISEEEMKLVRTYYNNEMTNGRNLLDDLKNEITFYSSLTVLVGLTSIIIPKDLTKIKFIQALY